MNKTEAAEYLGVGVRALERYTAQERIAVRYVKGKTRPTLDYDAAELERFKAELTAPVEKPAAQRPEEASPNSANTALAALGGNRGGALVLPVQVVELIRSTVEFDRTLRSVPDATQAAVKLLLTLAEVQVLTGLSRNTLRAAIDGGALPAQQIGRAWRIKRADLERYINEL